MKITIYELLGMVKDGKAPKKIKYENVIYEYDNYKGDSGYVDMTQEPYKWFDHEIDCDVKAYLNDEVKILEEPKGIPEKLELIENGDFVEIPDSRDLMNKINEIIDYLESKGE